MSNDINGVLIVDKPRNMSSAKVIARVKRLVKAKKAGHAGTLDPFATGVLVCLINRATRIARFFLRGNKKYEAVLTLGVETDTQDSSGKIISKKEAIGVSDKVIRAAFKQIEGDYQQVPPPFSALKKDGVPLYKLARSGNPIQKPARWVTISNTRILEVSLPTIRFEVSCSAGTYIRTLCADIGTILGCGSHLKELRRIKSSKFTLEEAVTLAELDKLVSSGKVADHIISMRDALEDFPEVVADRILAQKIMHGQPITQKEIHSCPINRHQDESTEYFKIVDKNKHLLAVLSHGRVNGNYPYCCVLQ